MRIDFKKCNEEELWKYVGSHLSEYGIDSVLVGGHPECKYLFIEFPPGPLAIGEDTTLQPKKSRFNGKVIKILSPTDCIKDRLASYIHFKSRETLEQAVLVA